MEPLVTMAEAHNAVAFQFAVSDEGVVVNMDREILKLMANSAYKSVKRRCNDAKNTFLKGGCLALLLLSYDCKPKLDKYESSILRKKSIII